MFDVWRSQSAKLQLPTRATHVSAQTSEMLAITKKGAKEIAADVADGRGLLAQITHRGRLDAVADHSRHRRTSSGAYPTQTR